MKKSILLFCISILMLNVNAQDASVESSLFGIQVGAIGFFVHNEAKLSNSIALRSEIGSELSYYSNSFFNKSGWLSGFSLTLEPRWYYNLNKRMSKSKRIDGNSGNFISLRVNYHPDVILFSSEDNINLISDITIIPTWGIRRNIGKHFNYEAAFGVGYIHYFEESNTIFDESDVGVNLHLRIGYRF